MVMRVRTLWKKTTREVQFYLTSLDCDARKLGVEVVVISQPTPALGGLSGENKIFCW